MAILLVGLNHRTAPVELREQFSLAGCGIHMALQEVPLGGSAGSLREVVILSTCNRLEVYAEARSAEQGCDAIEEYLARLQGLSVDAIRPYLYRKMDEDAIHHLMRVAAGLDSMILGEPQILGQAAQALIDAQQGGTAGPLLSHLFAGAVHAGKRARTETEISRHTTSVSHAAALLVKDKVPDIAAAHILIVGAGDMAELAARSFQTVGAQQITYINRTYTRAQSLAEQVGGEAFNWYHLPDALTWADAVITATGAPHTVIHTDDLTGVLPQRGARPLTFVDIAVPRDVEEAVAELPGVQCFDIDDLQSALDENLALREAAIPQVEIIIGQEAANYLEWLHSREVVPVIIDLRRKAEQLAQEEVEEALRHLNNLDQRDQDVIARMAHRLVNKLLHEPTVRLKARASEGDGHAYAHAVRDLFDLRREEDKHFAAAPNGKQLLSSLDGVASD